MAQKNFKIIDSWDYEWSRWDKVDSAGSGGFNDPILENELNLFLFKTKTNSIFWKGKRVLDAGCGNGRYSVIANELGAFVVSIDKGEHCCKITKNNLKDPEVVQMDIFKPCLKPIFDVIFSLGVLHHTPNPKQAFLSLLSALKEKGTMIIWVYRKESPIREYIFTNMRKITTKMPYNLLYILGYFFIPIVKILYGKKIHRVPIPKTGHHFFDWYSPRYRYHYTEEEIKSWLEETSLKDTEIYGWINRRYGGAIGAKGVKR